MSLFTSSFCYLFMYHVQMIIEYSPTQSIPPPPKKKQPKAEGDRQFPKRKRDSAFPTVIYLRHRVPPRDREVHDDIAKVLSLCVFCVFVCVCVGGRGFTYVCGCVWVFRPVLSFFQNKDGSRPPDPSTPTNTHLPTHRPTHRPGVLQRRA